MSKQKMNAVEVFMRTNSVNINQRYPSRAAMLAYLAARDGKKPEDVMAEDVQKQIKSKGMLFCECGKKISANKAQCKSCYNRTHNMVQPAELSDIESIRRQQRKDTK